MSSSLELGVPVETRFSSPEGLAPPLTAILRYCGGETGGDGPWPQRVGRLREGGERGARCCRLSVLKMHAPEAT